MRGKYLIPGCLLLLAASGCGTSRPRFDIGDPVRSVSRSVDRMMAGPNRQIPMYNSPWRNQRSVPVARNTQPGYDPDSDRVDQAQSNDVPPAPGEDVSAAEPKDSAAPSFTLKDLEKAIRELIPGYSSEVIVKKADDDEAVVAPIPELRERQAPIFEARRLEDEAEETLWDDSSVDGAIPTPPPPLDFGSFIEGREPEASAPVKPALKGAVPPAPADSATDEEAITPTSASAPVESVESVAPAPEPVAPVKPVSPSERPLTPIKQSKPKPASKALESGLPPLPDQFFESEAEVSDNLEPYFTDESLTPVADVRTSRTRTGLHSAARALGFETR